MPRSRRNNHRGRRRPSPTGMVTQCSAVPNRLVLMNRLCKGIASRSRTTVSITEMGHGQNVRPRVLAGPCSIPFGAHRTFLGCRLTLSNRGTINSFDPFHSQPPEEHNRNDWRSFLSLTGSVRSKSRFQIGHHREQRRVRSGHAFGPHH